MSNKTKTNTGENTNVKKTKIINFRPLDTKSRKDDQIWNAMELYGDSDFAESKYKQSVEVDAKKMESIRRRANRMFGRRILQIVGEAA